MRRNAPRSPTRCSWPTNSSSVARPHARGERRVGGRARQVERLLGCGFGALAGRAARRRSSHAWATVYHLAVSHDVNLRIPGPTPLPDRVREAGARQMVNHRGPEFKELINRVTERLKTAFVTRNDILILTASGTGGLEAAIVNFLSPGDPVLAVSIGSFGDRFAKIAATYGADVTKMDVEWGHAADPDAVARELRAMAGNGRPAKAILLTHNETSTGVENPLARSPRPFTTPHRTRCCLIDGISGLGAVPFDTDGWGLDVVATGSQKSWMSPPGLAMISVSERAWTRHRTGEDAALLLRPGQGAQVAGHGRDAVDAGSRRPVRDGRRARDARDRGLRAHLRPTRGVRRSGPGRTAGARLQALRRAGARIADGHRRVAARRCRMGRTEQGRCARAASSSPADRTGSPARSCASAILATSAPTTSSRRSRSSAGRIAELGHEVDVGAARREAPRRHGGRAPAQPPYRGREGPRRRAPRATRGWSSSKLSTRSTTGPS